ncbi:MAG: hypothetical protein KAS17_12335 [Victivallaceae bacterium]|nr:hypothetical protein [Victivallaceae bacterium]
MRNGSLADYFEQFVGRIKFEVDIPLEVLEAEIVPVMQAFHPDGEVPARLLKFSHSIAQSRDGKLRTLFEDLERARTWAKSEQRVNIKYEDLKAAVDWRKTGGLWPE